jgi:hypothetical protein
VTRRITATAVACLALLAGAAGAAAQTSTTTTPTTGPDATTTVPAPATTAPAPTASTPPATAPPTTTAPATAPADSQPTTSPGHDRAAVVLLFLVAAVALLALVLAGIARWQGWEPLWLLRWRHATGEAGYRAGNAWAEFTDWLRLGR